MSQSSRPSQNQRRKFLRGAAVVSAATVTAPTVVSAQGPISMRWQSTWPSKDIFHEYALDYAKKVNDMTGGDLKIEVLPAGAVVPAFGLLDAVSKGTLDGGHGVLVYHYGKQTALALWGSGPATRWTPTCCWPGTNTAAARSFSPSSIASIGANVVSFPYGPMLRRSRSAGSRSRSPRPTISRASSSAPSASPSTCSPGMGAAVNALPGGEIVSAMDRGLLDAAEFNNATSDRALGFADVSKVCMLQSYHQNAEQFEITFNKTKYDALPDKMKAIIANAVEAASQDMQWKAIDRYSKDYIELQTKDNVKFYKTPDAILKRQLEVYDEVVQEVRRRKSAVQGDRRIADGVCQAGDAMGTGHRCEPQMAFDHYFGPNA